MLALRENRVVGRLTAVAELCQISAYAYKHGLMYAPWGLRCYH